MAREIITLLRDDIDGAEASSTVAFGWDGVSYEIDLSKKNSRAFENAVAPYVRAARKASAPGRKAAPRKAAGKASKPKLDEIRSWARQNGYKVADRGRIPNAVIEAFAAVGTAVAAPVTPQKNVAAKATPRKATARKAAPRKAAARKATPRKTTPRKAAKKAPAKRAAKRTAAAS